MLLGRALCLISGDGGRKLALEELDCGQPTLNMSSYLILTTLLGVAIFPREETGAPGHPAGCLNHKASKFRGRRVVVVSLVPTLSRRCWPFGDSAIALGWNGWVAVLGWTAQVCH